MKERPQYDTEMNVTSSQGGWVGLLRAVLTTAGPVALIATLLVLFLGAAVWGRLDRIELGQGKIIGAMDQAQISMSAFSAQHTEIEKERTQMLRSQLNLLRQLCVNSAKSDFQTRGCLQE